MSGEWHEVLEKMVGDVNGQCSMITYIYIILSLYIR